MGLNALPEGVDNLAPHSFFTVSSDEPPVIQFTSTARKDSLRNAEATGEFVVNLSPAALFEQINATATAFPEHASEFDAAGVEREPSERVAPPRVADSPIAFECRLVETLSFGKATIAFGRVLLIAVDESVIDDGLPEIGRLDPIARLGRNQWSEIGRVRTITRIPYEEWPGHYEGAGGRLIEIAASTAPPDTRR